MSGVPRSQRLLAHTSAGADNSGAWTSPPGYVTLVKSIHVWNGGAAAGTVNVIIETAAPVQSFGMSFVNISSGAHLEWNGWIVLNPGDNLYATFSAASQTVWISGAVLAGPPQFPSA